jgi:transcriptional pleiotropic regulator of transition state genes
MVKKPAHKGKRVNQSSQKLIQRLRELLHEHPRANQGEYAQWLGVAQGRISQLNKLL